MRLLVVGRYTGDNFLEAEKLRLVVVDLQLPGVLLSPKILRVPLLLKGHLNFIPDGAVTLGGGPGVQSVKHLAATLNTAGLDEDLAVGLLPSFEEPKSPLCRSGDAPTMPGWLSVHDR